VAIRLGEIERSSSAARHLGAQQPTRSKIVIGAGHPVNEPTSLRCAVMRWCGIG
jgi:hypothetical protein